MISRLTGVVLAAGEFAVEVQPEGSPVTYTVAVPAYYEDHLRARTGHVRTLHTLFQLEGNQNATTYIPKLIGFPTAMDRRFFEMLIGLKGLGVKRALRVLARPPQSVALAINARDKDSLQTLPEVGKKLADTMIHDLHDAVQGYLATLSGGASDSSVMSPEGAGAFVPPPASVAPTPPDDLGHIDAKLRPVIEEAVGALVTLGESRKQATRLVTAAINEVKMGEDDLSSERILAAAFRQRDA